MTPLDGGALPPAANRSTLAIMRDFMPYLWPAGDKATKRRVSLAVALMTLQKVATVSVPLIYGVAVDLVADTQFTVAALLAVLIGYAVVRLAQQIFDELKHFVFARVASEQSEQWPYKPSATYTVYLYGFILTDKRAVCRALLNAASKALNFCSPFYCLASSRPF